jgi:hypothetical protein
LCTITGEKDSSKYTSKESVVSIENHLLKILVNSFLKAISIFFSVNLVKFMKLFESLET